MTSSHEPVQPTPFEAAQPAPETEAPQGGGNAAPRWLIPALLGLLVLAALVVFWLPEQVGDRPAPTAETAAEEQAIAGDGGSTAGSPAAAPSGPDITPWNEAQLAKLRKEAQDVLAELLDVQFALQERGVEQWAAEQFAAATKIAQEGDELYKQREYEQATARYRDGLAALEALQQALPDRVEQQLELARQAIESGDAEAGAAALDLATLMEQENAQLPPLQQRLELLPQVQALLQSAAAAETAGNLADAEEHLRAATSLDPAHQHAAAELERVAQAHVRQQFNSAMSEGYAALDDGRFDRARASFRRAAKLQPGSAEAGSALLEVDTAETAYRLATLKQRGAAFEQDERWQEAVDAYEKAREIDSNVLFAAEGMDRSGGRARLDKQFRAAIKEPERLSDQQVARATEAMLDQARKVQPRGPVLADQITQLERLLALANTPIAVTLLSDMETEVILYKVARLGRFQQHRLELRPGKYTAVGQRVGYRDVRREFTVSHEGGVTPVTVACTEPI
jgi:tetratricopeptide (TPR) repeat protein